jgi:hypothetical protein
MHGKSKNMWYLKALKDKCAGNEYLCRNQTCNIQRALQMSQQLHKPEASFFQTKPVMFREPAICPSCCTSLGELFSKPNL